MNVSDRILAAREGASVERVHTAPHVGSYRVDSHSHGIIMLLIILYPNASAELLRAAAIHDIAERWTGDVPGYILRVDPLLRQQVKRAEHDHAERCGFPMPELSAIEAKWLKSLDTFELWLWCQEQLAMGNRHVEAIEEDVRIWIETNEQVPQPVRDAFHEFARRGWRRLRHADLPDSGVAPGITITINYHPECELCGPAGEKMHVGRCTPRSVAPVQEEVVGTDPYPHHMADVTFCACRECSWKREQNAARDSSAVPPGRVVL